MDAFLGERSGECVPQRVNHETFVRESGFLKEWLELAAVEILAIHRSAHGVGKHEVVISPARPGLQAFCVLKHLVHCEGV